MGNIPLNIEFKFWPKVVVSTEPEAARCKDAYKGNLDLSMFLNGALGLNMSGALANKTQAKESGLNFEDCTTASSGKTVIMIKKSESPSIKQENTNCYIIYVGDCENVRAVEGFIVSILNYVAEK